MKKIVSTALPGITIALLAVTGFAQMPIFKRYYIADIPGFGWLAKFYVTHYLHYLLAVVLLAFLGYRSMSWFLERRWCERSACTTKIKRLILAGLVVTGMMLVIRNFPGYHFSPGVLVAVDLTHLGLTVLLMVNGVAGVCVSRISRDKNNGII
ncbi:MAG: hypothetical protein GY737_10725 [Desulfobacteraceae bacterium]|nr:hypothetical protein [Desulfobacteraceae bacterium]